MIGLDTNVLVRYFAQDDDEQSRAAEHVVDALSDDVPGFVSLVVLCELFWVLGRAYRLPRDEILAIVEGMLAARELRVQDQDVVHRSIRSSRGTSLEFVDTLIVELGTAAGCTESVTFDQRAADHPSMRLITS